MMNPQKKKAPIAATTDALKKSQELVKDSTLSLSKANLRLNKARLQVDYVGSNFP